MSQVVKINEPSSALTPMDMIDRALSSGASVETLGKLMELQERWDRNQAAKEFNAAIAVAKSEIKPIARNKTGHNHKKYADMAATATAVDPILSKHGLGYRYRSTQGERITVTCVLFHRSGHQEETTLTGPADTTGSKNAIQAIGSTLTYLERYSLFLALGLAAGNDDDGAGGPISEECISKIQKRIFEVAAQRSDHLTARVLRKYKVLALSDIRQSDFDSAMAAIETVKGDYK
jgi:hypothetical protein